MSPQRPLRRAYEADPEAVEAWNTDTYPAIRAEAAKVGATIFFGDEASVRSDFHSGTTWAPIGQTLIVPATGKAARVSVNMISVVSGTGEFHVNLIDGSMTYETSRVLR
jgi:hypothetical protein